MGNFHPQKEKAMENKDVLCSGNEAVDLWATTDTQIGRICRVGRFKILKLGSKSSPERVHPHPPRFPFHLSEFFFWMAVIIYCPAAGSLAAPAGLWRCGSVGIEGLWEFKGPNEDLHNPILIIINRDNRNSNDDVKRWSGLMNNTFVAFFFTMHCRTF